MQALREITSDLKRGMVDDLAASRYPKDAVASLINARIQPDGTDSRRKGTQRTHPTTLVSDGTCFGAVEYQEADGTRHIVAIFDDTAFHSTDGGATWTQLATTLREDYYSFATMRVGATTYLFAANGDTTIKRYDGTTWDTLPNAPSGVKFIEVFNNRLYAAGHNGYVVQATRIADPTHWASPFGLTIQVGTHDGDEISGLYQLGSQLLVFDRHATSYINGFGEQDIVVAVGPTGFSRSVGCVAFRTVVGVGENAVCWLSERGIEYYNTGAGIRLLSRGLQTFFGEDVNHSIINQSPGLATATYLDTTQEYFLALPTTTVARNTRILVFNLLQRGRGWLGAPSIDKQQVAGSATAITFSADGSGYLQRDAGGVGLRQDAEGYLVLASAGQTVLPTIEDSEGYLSTDISDQMAAALFIAHDSSGQHGVYSGGYDGFVRQHDTGDADDVLSDGTGGIAVTMTIVSRPFLFGRPSQRKRARVVHLGTIQEDPATYTVRIRANGAVVSERSISMPSTLFNQQKRRQVRVYAIGDSPQVELETSDDSRIALVGLAAELMRDRVP